jgi:hypothetical protein
VPNKAHRPSDTQRTEVQAYAAVGTPHHDIAKIVGIDTKTLLKHYPDELTLGKSRANAMVGRALFTAATAPGKKQSIAAAIFWLKAQAGWREKIDVEHSGSFTVVDRDPTQRPPGYNAKRRKTG